MPRTLTFADDAFSAPKANWGPGPWSAEPDLAHWERDGYQLLCERAHVGSWCGFVGVPVAHPWWGIERDQCPVGCPARPIETTAFFAELLAPFGNAVCYDCEHRPQDRLEAHGGITYSGPLASRERGGIGWWYFGFDCGHAFDYSPAIVGLLRSLGHEVDWMDGFVYHTLDYVINEVEQLYAQLRVVS